MKRSARGPGWLAAAAAILIALPAAAQTPTTEYEGVQALGLDLRRLGHTKRVLMIGAHPDDESTQILSTLALRDGAQVAYLSLTRGEGGQNGIGPELQEGLGLLRSEELLAARRIDGARQFFTRAYDYGYSKSAEEAFRHWPRDSLLADAVAVIRSFRPDLVISIFSGTPRDGHGQHQAAGIIAREAFEAAGDPERFPGLPPHRPGKLYQALWWRDDAAGHRLSTGELDPLLGRSHFQVAMASRSRHRSQDMGRILTPGPQSSALSLLAGEQAANGTESLFAPLDTTLSQHARSAGAPARLLADLTAYERLVAEAAESFDPFRPSALLPLLAPALARLDGAAAAAPDGGDLSFRLAWEREELEGALWRSAGLVLDAVAADEAVVPGQAFTLELTLWNGGESAVDVERLEPVLPPGWRADAVDALAAHLPPGTLLRRTFRVHVPADAAPDEPYFLRAPRTGEMYVWPDSVRVGVPFEAPAVRARAEVGVSGTLVTAEREAAYRGIDKMQGEVRRPIRVVPAVSVLIEPRLAVLPVAGAGEDELRFSVRLQSEAPEGLTGTLRPELPPGWRAEPAEVRLRFDAPGDERLVELSIRPPAGTREGSYPIAAPFVTDSGDRYARGYTLVDYPHTRPRPLFRPALATVRALDVAVPEGLRVGYVAGPGDEVQAALAQLGVRVEPLGPSALASADLGAFDVIVVGIRAYEVRPDLVTHNRRLLEFARSGGTLIVQYNKYEYVEPGIAPFAVEMARPHGRVADETAPVRILEPEHPVFLRPNRISPADFEGWVQERGLYFLSSWDPALVPLLETGDPGEEPLRGGLLVAPYGEGTYVYTGLSLFRQLPAGVPGAYRLFANLLALGAR